METGLYKITNLIDTNKIYIGRCQTTFKKRWAEHTRQLNKGTHVNKQLNADWLKYGADQFKFEVIARWDTITTKYKELVAVDAYKKKGFELYNVPSIRDNIILEVSNYLNKLTNVSFEIDKVDERCKGKKMPLHWQLYIKCGQAEIYLHLYNKDKYAKNGTLDALEQNIKIRKDFINAESERYDISKDIGECIINCNWSEFAKDIINEIMLLIFLFS